MKKKSFKFLGLLILFSSGMFTSCIDYVQTLGIDGDYYNSYYKISVPSVFLETAGMSADDFFQQFDELEEFLPYGAEINKIDNGDDVAIEFYVSVNVNTDDELQQAFLPYARSDGSEGFIPFFIGNFPEVFETILNAEGDEDLQAIVLTYMASSKCRLIINKNVIPSLDLSGGYFSGEDGNWYISCYDYGDSYCLEIPVSTLAVGRENLLDLSTIVIF